MGKKMYKMTVIVPSYNNGIYIRQCLDSIINQKTDFNVHIIVTDDASTDDSQSIIKEYEDKYSGLITAIYSKTNCRLFSNVLKALKIMNTEYYCVLDPDDYWTDEYRLQKAVDFLDKNPDYTIYATNLEIMYNDGSRELKYKVGDLKEKTSTYEDYLNSKAIYSTTAASTYRNVCFNHGIPEEFAVLEGTIVSEMFRADTARNLMHLNKGKMYFVNDVVAVYRYNEKGLFSSTNMAEKYIQSAFAHSCYYEYFGENNKLQYYRIISEHYKMYLKCCYNSMIEGSIVEIKDIYTTYAQRVEKWLRDNKLPVSDSKLRFSLKALLGMYDKKLVVWGTGVASQTMLEKYGIKTDKVEYFVDNSVSKQGTMFLDKKINAPDVLKNEDNVAVVIASSYADEIIEQIRNCSLCADGDIINLYDYDRHWN